MSAGEISFDSVRQVIADVMDPRHFQVREPLELEWSNTSHETIPWELFRGQLVQSHLTRETRKFESWNVHGRDELGRSEEPLLSVKFDHDRCEVHIVRAILCYVWEGYDSGGGVFLSREVQRWVRELVETISSKALDNEAPLRAKLTSSLFHAVVGMSRLPLTSLESPMPVWSLGRLAYLPDSPIAESSRALEWLIRSTPMTQLCSAVSRFRSIQGEPSKSSADTCRLFRAMFNEVSLSPYTDFVDKTLEFLRLLVTCKYLNVEEHVDFLGWLLRQLARHLTAYDLVTFHHRGANYPDALLLDAVLKEFLRLIEVHPTLFEGEEVSHRLRRRALRLGWLHRRRYEGHGVPDAATSPGENARVLPPPHVRVPEEQILNPAKRKKRLYENDPLPNHVGPNARRVLQVCGRDLIDPEELRELGMAIFIERPLSGHLPAGMPDASPLLAHEAYCRSLAERALGELANEAMIGLSFEDVDRCRAKIAEPWASWGMPASELPTSPTRIVSLSDAVKAAKDFMIQRTLPGSVRALRTWPGIGGLLAKHGVKLESGENWLILATTMPDGNPGLLIRDASGKRVVTAIAPHVAPIHPV